MKKTILPLLFGAALFTVVQPELGHAQFVGSQATSAPSTVADILKNGYDDQRVVLRGQVLRRVYGDKYIFSDGTAEIRVDIDQDEWPAGQPVNEKTNVEIIGKVDADWGRVKEIDVKVLRIAK